MPEAGDMEHAEAVYAAAKAFDEEEGGFKADGLEDSKVRWSWVIFHVFIL